MRFEDMINPNSEIGRMIMTGELQNTIYRLSLKVYQMKTTAAVFLVFVCCRIVQLISVFSNRINIFAKTIILAF